MKNIVIPMNILILSAFMLGSCKVNDPMALPTDKILGYSIIDGDTVKNRIEKEYTDKKIKEKLIYGDKQIVVGEETVTYKEPKLHTPPAKDPDLSKLKNNEDPDLKGKPLRMVAIGGSLTAGVRDGGYFNEGMITSYPNLIARQMKLKKFEQPLFDKADYNGFGRKVPTTENPTRGPVPKFKAVNNNSGVESLDATQIKLKKYKEKEVVDNYGVQNMALSYLQPFNNVGGFDWNVQYKINQELLLRIVENPQKSVTDKVFGSKYDVFLFEIGFDNLMNYIKDRNFNGTPPKPNQVFKERNPSSMSDIYIDGATKFMWRNKDTKIKNGCLLNLPNILGLPYFNMVSIEQVNAEIKKYNTNGGFRNGEKILPTSEIDSLLSPIVHVSLKRGVNKERPLRQQSYLNKDEQQYIQQLTTDFNDQTISFSKYLNIPYADIASLYAKILKGGYTTEDGVLVDASYPNGNFFSSDGIYPTALGQAIIANEVIKALNAFYKTEIPLIQTRELVSK